MDDRLKLERELTKEGFRRIAGIDEAGRGPLAGPVVAACVMMDIQNPIPGVRDSKKIASAKRAALAQRIREEAIAWGIGIVSPEIIDRINIRQATLLAMTRALEEMGEKPDYILIDGVDVLPADAGIPRDRMGSIVGGDDISYLVAAASILAKETRDGIMRELDAAYPQYGFAKHKGYGTAAHREAILCLGPSPVHRVSFLRKLTGRHG